MRCARTAWPQRLARQPGGDHCQVGPALPWGPLPGPTYYTCCRPTASVQRPKPEDSSPRCRAARARNVGGGGADQISQRGRRLLRPSLQFFRGYLGDVLRAQRAVRGAPFACRAGPWGALLGATLWYGMGTSCRMTGSNPRWSACCALANAILLRFPWTILFGVSPWCDLVKAVGVCCAFSQTFKKN